MISRGEGLAWFGVLVGCFIWIFYLAAEDRRKKGDALVPPCAWVATVGACG